MSNYKYNGKIIDFGNITLFPKSLSITESLNLNEAIEIETKLKNLKVTRQSIDESEILLEVAKNKTSDVYISNDFYVIEGNNEVIKNLLINDGEMKQKVFMINKSINDICEDYGTASTPQVMGDVTPPTIDRDINIDKGDGSGDVLQGGLKKDDEEVNEQQKLPLHFDGFEQIKDEDFEIYVNVSLARRVKQINDGDFTCNTLEGITKGKKGDYLVVGVDNEIYPCDKEIFLKTYKKIEF